MLHEAYRKLALLAIEINASEELGPKKHLANAMSVQGVKAALWDATFIAREMLPEVSLHFRRRNAGSEAYHDLEYVLIRDTNERIEASHSALERWLMDNAGVQRQSQVESASASIRKVIAKLEPTSQKRAFRHLGLLLKEITPSG